MSELSFEIFVLGLTTCGGGAWVHMRAVPVATRGVRSSGARVIGSCEPSNKGAGNQAQVL